MKSILLVAALAAFVALASADVDTCTPGSLTMDHLYKGKFSSSGVWTLSQVKCGKDVYRSKPEAFKSTIDVSEAAVQVGSYPITQNNYVLLLVDASGSQKDWLYDLTSKLMGQLPDQLAFSNISICVAIFDGRSDVRILADWTTDVKKGLSSLGELQQKDYVIPDTASNLNGAIVAMGERLNAKVNSTRSLTTFSQGLLILTGDGKDTAGSAFNLGMTPMPSLLASLTAGSWKKLRFAVLYSGAYDLRSAVFAGLKPTSGATYMAAGNGTTNQYATVFQSISEDFGNSTVNLRLVKVCTPLRSNDTPWNRTLALEMNSPRFNPNLRQFTINYEETDKLKTEANQFYLLANGFSKGCDLNGGLEDQTDKWADIDKVVASSASMVVMSIAVLFAAALF